MHHNKTVKAGTYLIGARALARFDVGNSAVIWLTLAAKTAIALFTNFFQGLPVSTGKNNGPGPFVWLPKTSRKF